MAAISSYMISTYGYDAKHHFELAWEIQSQSAVSNTSTIAYTFTLFIHKNQAGSAEEVTVDVPYSIAMNGSTIFSGKVAKGRYSSIEAGHLLKSGTITIEHNVDGTKSFTYSFTISAVAGFSGRTRSGTADLQPIDKKAILLSAPNFTDLDNPTITYNNPAKENVKSLQACISFDGYSIDIPYRAISKTDTSYTFNLTNTEKATLFARVTNGNSTTVMFYIKTIINKDITYLHSLTRTFTITNPEPILNPTVIDSNADTVALTGDNNVLIKYRSNAQFMSGAAAVKGARITKEIFTNGSMSYLNQSSGTITRVESNIFDFSVTDSRGYTTRKTIAQEMINYIPLTANLKIDSFTASGELKFTIKGKYYNGSFGARDNAMSLKVELIESDSSAESLWINLGEISPTVDNVGNYTFSHTVTDLNHRKSYAVHIQLADLLTPTVDLSITAAPIPIFDWGKNDFNFNVPVTIQGAQLLDFVIEAGEAAMGSNGTWRWEKWNSGKAVCYGCRNYGNTAVSTAWGSLYRSEIFNQELPDGLFSAIPDIVDISLRQGSYGGWIVRHEQSAPTKDDTGSFIIVRPANANISQAYISFNVIGKWT